MLFSRFDTLIFRICKSINVNMNVAEWDKNIIYNCHVYNCFQMNNFEMSLLGACSCYIVYIFQFSYDTCLLLQIIIQSYKK